jgi:hypothetical protein
VPIKLVVSGSSKESRIALVGQTGKELLASATFTEPRAKGATMRALKKILGADVIVEDSTTATRKASKRVAPVKATAAKTTGVAAKKTAAAVRSRRQASAPAVKTPAPRKTAKRSAKSAQPA